MNQHFFNDLFHQKNSMNQCQISFKVKKTFFTSLLIFLMEGSSVAEEYTPSPDVGEIVLTGFSEFACESPMFFMFILMFIFLLPNIIFILIAKIKGKNIPPWFSICYGLVINCCWGALTDFFICLHFKSQLLSLIVSIIIPLFGLYVIFINIYCNFCKKKISWIERQNFKISCCNVPKDDGIFNADALIDKIYSTPPVIYIEGKARQVNGFTTQDDRTIKVVVEYGSWESSLRKEPRINIDYGMITVVPKFIVSKAMTERINNKIQEIRIDYERRNFQLIDTEIVYQIEGIKSKYHIFSNSKIAKFINGLGLVCILIFNFFGYLPVLETIFELFSNDLVINIEKRISESDDLPNQYSREGAVLMSDEAIKLNNFKHSSENNHIENPVLNQPLLNEQIPHTPSNNEAINPYTAVSDDIPSPYVNDNSFPLQSII